MAPKERPTADCGDISSPGPDPHSPAGAMIAIEPATKEDLAEILRIEKLCFASPWSLANFNAELENEHGLLLVARLPAAPPNRVVGYLCAWIAGGEVQVANLAVHPDWRRRGIGRALLVRALRIGCRLGADSAVLEVRRGNVAAIKLYQSLGFELLGTRPGYYDGETALVLALRLDRAWGKEAGGQNEGGG